MSREEKYELFSAYLDHSLSESEQSELNTLLLDKEYKIEFDEFCNIHKSYQTIFEQKQKEVLFIENLKNIGKECNELNTSESILEKPYVSVPLVATVKDKSKGFTFFKSVKINLAASLVVLLSIYIYTLTQNASKSPSELFASNYEAAPISMERGLSNDTLASIVRLYNAKKYVEVTPSLTQYAASHLSNNDIQLALALCQMETNDFSASENSLTFLIQNDNEFKEKAQWYLGMLYLKQGQKENAIKLLESFTNEHFYYKKGKEILKSLK
jgi:predicted negative regulator of RcsB-dependent stress response